MVFQLKGLLGKSYRSIVICGKVFTLDKQMVVVRAENYHEYFVLAGRDSRLDTDRIYGLMSAAVHKFEQEFGVLLRPYDAENEENFGVTCSVDSFTGAIVIETFAYKELISKRLHNSDLQLSVKQAELIKKFAVSQWVDYYDLYCKLFNRRLLSQYMPYKIKSHFVAGLFQPLVVETELLPSPLTYGEASWLYSYLRTREVLLESRAETARKITITAISSYDIAQLFQCNIIREWDRKAFMFVLTIAALDQLDREAGVALTKQHKYTFNKIMNDQNTTNLLSNIMQYGLDINKSLRVVN